MAQTRRAKDKPTAPPVVPMGPPVPPDSAPAGPNPNAGEGSTPDSHGNTTPAPEPPGSQNPSAG